MKDCKDSELHHDLINVLKKHKVDPITAMSSLSYILGLSCAASGMPYEYFKTCLDMTGVAFKDQWDELISTAKTLMIMKKIK